MPLYSDFATYLYTVSTLPEVKFWVELVFKMTLTTANITVAGKGLAFLEWAVVWWLFFVNLFWEVHVFFHFVFKFNSFALWLLASFMLLEHVPLVDRIFTGWKSRKGFSSLLCSGSRMVEKYIYFHFWILCTVLDQWYVWTRPVFLQNFSMSS